MNLQAYITRERLTIGEFARRIQVRSHTTVHRYKRGEKIPRRDVMRRIYIATGGNVAPNDFYDLPEVPAARVERLEAGARRTTACQDGACLSEAEDREDALERKVYRAGGWRACFRRWFRP